MIIFDSTYLVVFLNANPPPRTDRQGNPVSRFKERVDYLAARMDASHEVIGVPSPAMAEVLVRAGNGRAKMVSILSDRWRFQILPFDSRAAIEASELIAKIKTSKEPWATWAKVKFDIQIVSIAKAEAATAIYADDKDIERYAKRVNIPVIRICDLPLPPDPESETTKQETLPLGTQQALDWKAADEQIVTTEGKQNEPTTASAGKDNKLEADPAHPTAVQGSDSGRAQGEATGESEKATET